MTSNGLVKIAIVGADHRSEAYASYAFEHPDKIQVVAVADPDPVRRGRFGNAHRISADRRFERHTDIASRPGAGQMDGHGGGDTRLIGDFISIIGGGRPSKSVTAIQDSLTGRLIAFAADKAMLERRVVVIQ